MLLAELFEAWAALAGLVAAVLWFASARNTVPKLASGESDVEDFPSWVRRASVLNRRAAIFSALAALLTGAAQVAASLAW